MFVGHAALAFAIVGLGARGLGVSRDQALALGVVAAIGATIPDLDMLAAFPTLLFATGTNLIPVEAFWDGATAHRSLTHSLFVALPIATSVGLIAGQGWRRIAGLGLAGLTALVLVALPEGQVVIVGPFVLAAVVLGIGAGTRPITGRAAGLAAGVGLLSHPFGDLLTGEPPWLFYPTGFEVITGRVTLAVDPTFQLLAAFFLEIGAIWAGLYALSRLRGTRLETLVKPRAALGTLFAAATFIIPAPTLAESYQFVFGVLAFGAVGFVPRDRREPLTWIATGLTAVTVGGLAYAFTYLLGVL